MSSSYQFWLTYNNEREKVRFPVLPESISIKNGSLNKSVTITGLGEIVIKQDRPALTISFSSFFPAAPFPGAQFPDLAAPEAVKEKITSWKNNEKPCHFLVTGTKLNLHCTIEDFSCVEQGGDVGALHYTLVLKEYREVSARRVKVDKPAKKAALPPQTPNRTDDRVPPKTYTVVAGDCLWNIAARLLGSGSRYTEIADLNRDSIKSPNLIYPGQVLKLP